MGRTNGSEEALHPPPRVDSHDVAARDPQSNEREVTHSGRGGDVQQTSPGENANRARRESPTDPDMKRQQNLAGADSSARRGTPA